MNSSSIMCMVSNVERIQDSLIQKFVFWSAHLIYYLIDLHLINFWEKFKYIGKQKYLFLCIFFTFCTTQTQICSILNKKIQKLCKMKNKIWCRDQPCALISYAHKSTLNVWNEKRAQAVSELHKMGRVKMQVYIIREWNLNCKKYFLHVLTFKKINEEM